MKIKPLRKDLKQIIKNYQLTNQYIKQASLFCANPYHPSLHTEKLLPKQLKIYSFRIDQKWRAIFIYIGSDEIEIIDINPHYAK